MADNDAVERDYFTDPSVLREPYEYFGEMLAQCPVHQMKSRDVLMVSGYEEVLEVLRNNRDFSSLNSVPGAHYDLPFDLGADDISDQLRERRHTVYGNDTLVTMDDAEHLAQRSLLHKLFVPSRLKANEEFMEALADRMATEAAAKGGCELMGEIATPFATLVIADLLGVPDEDRDDFMRVLDMSPPPGNMNEADAAASMHPLAYMESFFKRYIEDRRANPTDDILTEFAHATYPDGSSPDTMVLVKLSSFLFGAGQDTSAKLVGNAIRYLVDVPGLQDQLRADRSLLPGFIEEVLRLEGSSKITSRVARRKAEVAGTEIPAGKRLLIGLAAGNRDARRWDDPDDFKLGRPKIKEHLSFGRGPHVCAGAPLARAEVRILLDRLLEHTSEIGLSEAEHGPPGARTIEFEPSWIVRGVAKLYVTMKPR